MHPDYGYALREALKGAGARVCRILMLSCQGGTGVCIQLVDGSGVEPEEGAVII